MEIQMYIGKDEQGNKIYGKMEPFCFWECGHIGINICDKDKIITGYDLTLQEAKSSLCGLQNAIVQFEDMESQYSEWVETDKMKTGDEECLTTLI